MPFAAIKIRDFVVPPLDHASNLGVREVVEVRLHSQPNLRWVQLFRAIANRLSDKLVASNPRVSNAAIVFESAPADATALCREFVSLVDRVNDAVILSEVPSPADLHRRRTIHRALREAVNTFRLEWLAHGGDA
jgi:hypothetical protein